MKQSVPKRSRIACTRARAPMHTPPRRHSFSGEVQSPPSSARRRMSALARLEQDAAGTAAQTSSVRSPVGPQSLPTPPKPATPRNAGGVGALSPDDGNVASSQLAPTDIMCGSGTMSTSTHVMEPNIVRADEVQKQSTPTLDDRIRAIESHAASRRAAQEQEAFSPSKVAISASLTLGPFRPSPPSSSGDPR